jgi:hypothetical protein
VKKIPDVIRKASFGIGFMKWGSRNYLLFAVLDKVNYFNVTGRDHVGKTFGK